MKPSLDDLQRRAAQERNDIHQTAKELASSIGDLRREFTLSVQLKKHFATASIFLCAFAFFIGYRTGAIFDPGCRRS